MPFTFSHPAIVLPLARLSPRWVSITGLILGSLTPDFEYFIRMRMYSAISHKFIGLFLFDLPVGIALTFIFHNIIRNPLYDHLPLPVRQRAAIYKTFDWNTFFQQHWPVVIASILIGAASHLVWDSFTHSYTYFTDYYSFLRIQLDIMGYGMPVYRVLQHVSTMFGAVVIGMVILSLPVVQNGSIRNNKWYWPVVIVSTMAIVITRLAFGIHPKFYAQLIVTVIPAFLIGLVITPILLNEK